MRYAQVVRGAFVAIGLGHNLAKYEFQITEVADLVAPTPSALGAELASYINLVCRDRKVFGRYLLAERKRRDNAAADIGSDADWEQLEVPYEM